MTQDAHEPDAHAPDAHAPDAHASDTRAPDAHEPDANEPDASPARVAAASYLARGWCPIPLYEPVDGGCSCGKPGCSSAGKHPRVRAWQSQAPDLSAWDRWPTANVGLALHGMVAVDIDGDAGEAEWAQLCAMHGDAPPTLEQSTGNGRHLLYLGKSRNRHLAPHVHLRGEGGQIAAAPSLHRNGRRYRWLNDLPLASAPEWILGHSAWLRAAIDGEIAELARATEGGRNAALYKASLKLGSRCATDSEWRDAEARLIETAVGIGLGIDETQRTIASGRRAGAEHPRAPSDGGRGVHPSAPTAPASGARCTSEAQPWEPLVRRRGDGDGIIADLANAMLIVAHDTRIRLAWDAFAYSVLVRAYPGALGALPRALGNEDATRLTAWMLAHIPWAGSKELTSTTVANAMAAVARETPIHPVREYLQGLRWDAVLRLPTWLRDYCYAEGDAHYLAEAGARWMVSAIARVMRPGCQADSMLVLESARQGMGKTSLVRILGGQWSSEQLDAFEGKEACEQLRGKWIVEIAELRALARADAGAARAFISRAADHYRPPYARETEERARQCVFVGTTNEDQWHSDTTGSRRFWPVRVGRIALDALRRDRDQLWAEAMTRYDSGEQWHLDDRASLAADEAGIDRRREDPWERRIVSLLAGRAEVTVPDLLGECGVELGKATVRDAARVAALLRTAGLRPVRVGTKRVWVRE